MNDGKNGLNRKTKITKKNKKKKHKIKPNTNHLKFLPPTKNLHYPQ